MPLRVRLTSGTAAPLPSILIIFSTVLYFDHGSQSPRCGRSIAGGNRRRGRALARRTRVPPLIDEDELMSQFPELARIDKFFQIFSPSGTITIRSPNVKQHELPLSRPRP